MHMVADEADLDPEAPLLQHRSYAMFVSAMCKPNLTAIPVTWHPGFHYRDKPAVFGDLFLFHLRYADARRGLARLQLTREMAWQLPTAGAHERLPDDEWMRRVKAWNAMKKVEDDPWSAHEGVFKQYTDALSTNQFYADHLGIWFAANEYRAGVYGQELLRIPDAFRNVL